MKTEQHRLVILGSALGMVVLVVGGWFLVAQPQLASADTLDQQRVAAESQIAASSATVAALQKDKANIGTLQSQLDALRASIPASLDPSGFISGLGALASSNGVTVTSIGVQDAVKYTQAAGTASTPATTSTATPAPTTTAVPGAATTNSLITADNFVLIPVTVSVSGPSANVLNFVSGLQSGGRLFLVTNLTTAHDAANAGSTTGTIQGYIYAIPTGYGSASATPAPSAAPAAAPAPTTAAPAPVVTTPATTSPNPAPTSTGASMPTPNPTRTP